MTVDPAKVRELASEQHFYDWLREHGAVERELWIRIFKVRSGIPSVSPSDAVDAALCWGWIDGIRKSLDDVSFLQRYTPRGKKSVWSLINVAKVERLTAAGRMQPAGLAHVAAAKADGRWARAYGTTTEAPQDLLAAIRSDPKALATYDGLTAQNRFALTFRLLAIKTDDARKRRIAAYVAMLARGETIHPQSSPPKDARATKKSVAKKKPREATVEKSAPKKRATTRKAAAKSPAR